MLAVGDRKCVGQQARQDDRVFALCVVHGVDILHKQKQCATYGKVYFFHGLNVTVDLINKYARSFCLPNKKPRRVATAGF